MAATSRYLYNPVIVGIYIQLDKWGRGIPEGAKNLPALGALKLIVSRIFEKGIGHAIEVLVLDVLVPETYIHGAGKLEWLMHILIFGMVGLLILTIVAAAAEFRDLSC